MCEQPIYPPPTCFHTSLRHRHLLPFLGWRRNCIKVRLVPLAPSFVVLEVVAVEAVVVEAVVVEAALVVGSVQDSSRKPTSHPLQLVPEIQTSPILKSFPRSTCQGPESEVVCRSRLHQDHLSHFKDFSKDMPSQSMIFGQKPSQPYLILSLRSRDSHRACHHGSLTCVLQNSVVLFPSSASAGLLAGLNPEDLVPQEKGILRKSRPRNL